MNKNKNIKKPIIDKHSIQYLKYRDIAIEFIKQGYNNIRGIYHKYYPDASDESIDCEAYRLLDNVRFQIALEEVYNEIKIEDLELAKKALKKLYSLMNNSKKESIQLEAAIWLGKTGGEFIEKHQDIPVDKPDNQFSLNRLVGIKQADTQ